MTEKIIVTGSPAWLSTLREQVPDAFELLHYPLSERYVFNLTDDRPALILVDGDADDWSFWSATPKSNSATRRIPIVLVSESETGRGAGADHSVTPAELLADFAGICAAHARVVDPAREEQLDCECQEALPPLAVQGVEKFNNREFYPQHDLFEEQWMETEGPVRDLYRAVLQVGVAYYQIERGNHRGALKMLLRSVQWLEALPDVCQTIDVAQLRADAYAVRDVLESMDPAEIETFDLSMLKPVKRV